VRVYDHEGYTRVVVELSDRAAYRINRIGDPARLYIDIDGTWIEPPQRAARESGRRAPLIRVRGGPNTLSTARIVLELDHPERAQRTFFLEKPYRIVTDVFTGEPPATGTTGSSGSAHPAPSGAVTSFDMRPVRRVVIDPGHGGKDPGASGPHRLREKRVVLRIAKRLSSLLRREGLDVVLTRADDTYLTLEERTAAANRAAGDLFVSIHANASRNRRTHGVETYLLDTRYDRQTARVAARENGTTVEKLNDLQVILLSLRLGYNERYASRLAQHVNDSLVSRLRKRYRGTQDLGVKRGPFLVLFQVDMPAILVEVGFLSNRGESKRMRTDAFAQTAAEGIARGILAYRGEHARGLVAGR
jgi:N-acetylmuramoyl-L-alanine amidase